MLRMLQFSFHLLTLLANFTAVQFEQYVSSFFTVIFRIRVFCFFLRIQYSLETKTHISQSTESDWHNKHKTQTGQENLSIFIGCFCASISG